MIQPNFWEVFCARGSARVDLEPLRAHFDEDGEALAVLSCTAAGVRGTFLGSRLNIDARSEWGSTNASAKSWLEFAMALCSTCLQLGIC